MVKKITIGRIDRVDFPKLQLFDIDVKVDTGAYTSSLHCHHIEEIERDGKRFLSCKFLDPSHADYNNKEFQFEEYALRKVKSSNGILETRFSIVAEIEVFGQNMPIEMTLTERGSMKYPILLGRKFLNKKFVVDTAKTNISYNQKTNRHK